MRDRLVRRREDSGDSVGCSGLDSRLLALRLRVLVGGGNGGSRSGGGGGGRCEPVFGLDEPAGCLALERVDLESMSNLIPKRAERWPQAIEVDVVGGEDQRWMAEQAEKKS